MKASSIRVKGEVPNHAFTLIELLVVLAILAILAGLLFPVFSRARESGYRTQATSNAKQQSLAVELYATEHDDSLPPYFSGYDPGTNTYHDPQKYWPELVASHIAVVHGRGYHGQALADDLPAVFFDPIKSFKSQLQDAPNAIGIQSGWGFSNVMAQWLDTTRTAATKLPRKRDSLVEPAQTVLLTETKDWLGHGKYTGVALSLGIAPLTDGSSAADSTDAPYAKTSDGDGINITVFADGHVKGVKRSTLIKNPNLWGDTENK